MEKVKNTIKEFNKHICLYSIILLIVFTILHFLLELVHIKFRKWVYVTIISIFLIGIFIKILQILYSKIKIYKEKFFKYASIIIGPFILSGIIFWPCVLLIILFMLLMIDSNTDYIIPNYEHVVEKEGKKYVATVNPMWLDTQVDYYKYINFFIMGNEVKFTEHYNGSYDPLKSEEEKSEEEIYNRENTISNNNYNDMSGLEDTENTEKFEKISEENLIYEKIINDYIIIRVGKVGNSLGGKMGIEIQKTTNGGETWQNQIKSQDAYILVNNEAQITFINENVGFINNNSMFILGQENNSLLVTVDGGESFKAANFVFPEDIKDNAFYIQDLPILSNEKLTIVLFAPKEVGSTDGNYYKFVSVDNGQNWTIYV